MPQIVIVRIVQIIAFKSTQLKKEKRFFFDMIIGDLWWFWILIIIILIGIIAYLVLRNRDDNYKYDGNNNFNYGGGINKRYRKMQTNNKYQYRVLVFI